MRHSRIAAALATAAIVVTMLPTAVFAQSPAASLDATGKVFGLSVKTVTNDPFQAAWVDSATKTIEAAGGTVQLAVAGGQTNVANQVSQLADLVAKHVNGIIVSPMDGAAVLPVLQQAKTAGIPVILVDQPVQAGNEALYETLIATDNVKAGQDLATYLVNTMTDPALKVAIIEGAPGSVAGDDRLNGFLAGLATKNIKPVASATGEWDNAKALAAMENILTANPDLQAVLSASDVMVDGILQALAGANKTDVKVLAIDGSKVGIQGVIDGKLLADNTQDPMAMGSKAAEYLIGIADGTIPAGSLPKYIDSGTTTVTKDNAQEAMARAF
jgi:ABC-type sugar transport system substrate-binding protein